MPARDRTDAVDWSAVEARVARWCESLRETNGRIRARALELEVDAGTLATLDATAEREESDWTAALAAVRLVRALEEGPLNGIVLVGLRNKRGGWEAVARGPHVAYAETALAAVTRALDASKGEG